MPVRLVDEEDVANIRRLRATGTTTRGLAKRFGVSEACIDAIVRGKPWRRLAKEGITGDLFDRRVVAKGR